MIDYVPTVIRRVCARSPSSKSSLRSWTEHHGVRHRCRSGGEADQRFLGMRSRLPLSCRLWQVQVTPLEESSKVVVCASTADMILWDQMIRDFNNRSEVVK